MKKGAHQAVVNCVRLKKDERVVIITDENTKEIASHIEVISEEISPGNVKTFIMEEYGERCTEGKSPLDFPNEIKSHLEKAHVSFYVAETRPGELVSFRVPMVKIIEANNVRHAHMPNFNSIMMQEGMGVDYNEVDAMCDKVYKIVKNAKKIKVTNPAGTDFTAEFDPDYKWLKSGPYITSDQWGNLPAGEVFTCVGDIKKGKVVVDGVLGDYFDRKYGLLDENPVYIDIKNGRAISFKCKDKKLEKDIKKYSKQDKNASRIGEFAIGTNIGLTRLIGRMLQDEKYPGVHLSLGHGYPEKTGSGWYSDAHLDMVLKDCTIEVDGKKIMKKGKFLI